MLTYIYSNFTERTTAHMRNRFKVDINGYEIGNGIKC